MSQALIQSLNPEETVAVIGMGVSNIPLIHLLLDHNISVTVRDKNPDKETKALFQSKGAFFQEGEDYLADITEDVVFRTPGVSPLHPCLVKAKAQGKRITSEMQEFFRACPCPVIAVTGSDGKTTTTTLISRFLEQEGKTVFVGGNIGTPLLSQVDAMTQTDVVVLELSSFQLMDLDCDPRVAVITNLSPNHLDYHKNMAEYVEAKTQIFRNQTPSHSLVLNQDNAPSLQLESDVPSTVVYFGRESTQGHCSLRDGVIYLGDTPVLPVDSIRLKGVHNIENYMAAITAVEGICSVETIVAVAEEFTGVEHRMQLVRTIEGVDYFNDSIATSPTRCIAGLHSFETPIILIAGGYDKGIPFDHLGKELIRHVKELILVGDTSQAIHQAVTQALDSGEGEVFLHNVTLCHSLDEAVKKAADFAQSGDAVVLSPACAAFDQFKNFAERGRYFMSLVESL